MAADGERVLETLHQGLQQIQVSLASEPAPTGLAACLLSTPPPETGFASWLALLGPFTFLLPFWHKKTRAQQELTCSKGNLADTLESISRSENGRCCEHQVLTVRRSLEVACEQDRLCRQPGRERSRS